MWHVPARVDAQTPLAFDFCGIQAFTQLSPPSVAAAQWEGLPTRSTNYVGTGNPPVPFPLIVMTCGESSALLVTFRVAVTGALLGGMKLIVTFRSAPDASDPVNPFHENVELDPENETEIGLPVGFLIRSTLLVVLPVVTCPNSNDVALNAKVPQLSRAIHRQAMSRVTTHHDCP